MLFYVGFLCFHAPSSENGKLEPRLDSSKTLRPDPKQYTEYCYALQVRITLFLTFIMGLAMLLVVIGGSVYVIRDLSVGELFCCYHI